MRCPTTATTKRKTTKPAKPTKTTTHGVTDLVHQLFPFQVMAAKRYTLQQIPTYPDTHECKQCVTFSDIDQVWKRNRVDGTSMHRMIEYMLKKDECPVPDEALLTQFAIEKRHFEDFLIDHPCLEFYWSEHTLYDPIYPLRGTLDAVFRNTQTQNLVVVDFKRARVDDADLYPMFQPPSEMIMRHFPGFVSHNKHMAHCLQVALYVIMLENNGFEVDDAFVLNMHPSLPAYEIHRYGAFRVHLRALLDEYFSKKTQQHPLQDNHHVITVDTD